MSWGFSFLDPNFLYPAVGGQPSAGPGLNVPNLLKEGWIPKDRIIAIGPRPRRADQVTLAALSHPTAPGMLTVELLAGGRTNPTFYTVEYRQQDGWDKAMPNNAVVIHSYLSAATGGTPYSYLQRISNEGQRLCFTNPEQCQFLSGQTWVEPSNAFKLTVNSIDPSTGTANLTIGP
jgi:hypothetical protein